MDKLKVDYILGKRSAEVNGIYRYAWEIIKNGQEAVDGSFIDYNPKMQLPVINKSPALLVYPLVVTRRIRKDSIKHLCSHIQAHLLNYLKLEPSVVTCFDIYPFLQDQYPFMDRNMVKLGLRGMLKADRIITISEYSGEEIAQALGYPREKIRVTHLGVDHRRFRPLPRDASLRERYAVPAGKRIILYVGSEQPRKNVLTLIEAFATVKRDCANVVLLKVGRPQWKTARQELEELIRRLGLRDDVIFIDYLPEEELPALYNSADLFAFPSVYEGFGLPPLEAMACGCPVVSSNTSSLPEVVGEAGIMVDPHDTDGLASAMCEVLSSDDLGEELIRKGLEQARKFNWEKTANETIMVYKEIMQ
jgi:glycosyltransferase involved in cell wall biosynthesis